MLYLFAGDDSKKKYSNLDQLLASLKGAVEVFTFNKNNFFEPQVRDFYSSQDLFARKYALVFDNVLEEEGKKDFILKHLDALSEALNLFIFLEGKMDQGTLAAFKKSRAELGIFELPKEKKEKFDNFLLAYALGNRDKLKLWIHFREAVGLGVGLEELVGVLFWKGKDMILRKNFSKFTLRELENFVSKISYLLPEARKQGADAEIAFEKFLLEAF